MRMKDERMKDEPTYERFNGSTSFVSSRLGKSVTLSTAKFIFIVYSSNIFGWAGTYNAMKRDFGERFSREGCMTRQNDWRDDASNSEMNLTLKRQSCSRFCYRAAFVWRCNGLRRQHSFASIWSHTCKDICWPATHEISSDFFKNLIPAALEHLCSILHEEHQRSRSVRWLDQRDQLFLLFQ